MERFNHELIVDNTKILEVPPEHVFHTEPKPARVSGWTSREALPAPAQLNAVLEREGLRRDAIIFRPRGDNRPLPSPPPSPSSRFGEEWERAFRPVPVDFIPHGLTGAEVELLLRLHRLDDLNAREASGRVELPARELRSPSPDPVYDGNGRRINVPEQRARDSQRIERANLIEQCQKLSPCFITPNDWRPLRRSRKIYFPVWEGAELSYAALVLGPRGRTQKLLEDVSGCRVSVRRAGNEPAHVLIAADDEQQLQRGVELTLRLLEGESPEQLSDGQPRFVRVGYEALALETVLRDCCATCNEEGHKTWNCPYTREEPKEGTAPKANPFSLSEMLKCGKCGRRNHLTRDCHAPLNEQAQSSAARDAEYAAFLRDIGVGVATGALPIGAARPSR